MTKSWEAEPTNLGYNLRCHEIRVTRKNSKGLLAISNAPKMYQLKTISDSKKEKN